VGAIRNAFVRCPATCLPPTSRGSTIDLPNAAITFDRFHVMKIITSAADAVRRAEWRKDKTVKGSRYALLKNPENLIPR